MCSPNHIKQSIGLTSLVMWSKATAQIHPRVRALLVHTFQEWLIFQNVSLIIGELCIIWRHISFRAVCFMLTGTNHGRKPSTAPTYVHSLPSSCQNGIITQRNNGTHQFFSSFKKNFFYFFIFGCAGSLLLCRFFSSYGERGLFCCKAQALGTRASALPLSGSIAVVRGVRSFQSCGVFPDQGPNRVSCIGKWVLYH